MENSTKTNKIIPTILLVLLIVSIGSSIYLYQNYKDIENSTQEEYLNFFNDYVIAVNDYHMANSYFELAGTNLDIGNWYSETEDYYYYDAISFYSGAKEQLTEGKEYLKHARLKLNNIKENAPNEFYVEEVNNRIEQINIFSELVDQYFLLNEYVEKELYEINYGSETEATRYYNMYNDLIEESNTNLKKLSDISQKIDLSWDQNWYPLFEGV